MAVLGTAPRGGWYTPGEEDEGWDTTEGLSGERGVWERARERVGIPYRMPRRVYTLPWWRRLVLRVTRRRRGWTGYGPRSAEHAGRDGGCTLDHYSRVGVWYQAIAFLATRSIARHPLPARAIGPARVVAKIGEETRASTTAIGAGRDIAHRSWLRRKREGTSTPLRKVDGLATVEVCLGHGDSIR
jgi:hypothetical protein